jgi:hypothetical protein
MIMETPLSKLRSGYTHCFKISWVNVNSDVEWLSGVCRGIYFEIII